MHIANGLAADLISVESFSQKYQMKNSSCMQLKSTPEKALLGLHKLKSPSDFITPFRQISHHESLIAKTTEDTASLIL